MSAKHSTFDMQTFIDMVVLQNRSSEKFAAAFAVALFAGPTSAEVTQLAHALLSNTTLTTLDISCKYHPSVVVFRHGSSRIIGRMDFPLNVSKMI